jgi:magnesium-protoporphyrin IX monomethyl ester (oxidative) cyclase
MRVLLVNPPDELDAMLGVGKEFIQNLEPLGLLYIAAVLRERGHDVRVIDAHAERLGTDDVRRRIESEQPEILGFSTLTCNGAMVWDLGRWARQTLPATFVVLGNVHAAVFARQYVQHGCCDAVVHGEGEWVMADLADRLSAGSGWSDLPGLSFMGADGCVHLATDDAVVDDLTLLPLPARDLVDQSLYGLGAISNQIYVPERGGRAKTMVTSRGCPNRCTFCVVHGCRRPRFNSAVRVVDEMEHLQDLGTSYVFIDDPLFLANRRRVLDICSEYRRRGLAILWGGPAHVKYVDEELVKALDAANCYDLSLGLESGVQRLLDAVRKNITVDQIREAVRTIKTHSDIHVEGLFILGLPGETTSDSLETIRFARELPLDMAQFSIFTPYPGSPVFDELAARGEINTGIGPDGSVDPSVWIRYSQYICFTDIEPIWVTPGLTVDELRRLQKKAIRDFYLRPSQILRHVRRLRPGNLATAVRIVWKAFW